MIKVRKVYRYVILAGLLCAIMSLSACGEDDNKNALVVDMSAITTSSYQDVLPVLDLPSGELAIVTTDINDILDEDIPTIDLSEYSN